MLLEEWMPAFDASSRHAIDVRAGAAASYAAARALDLGALPLARVLMGLRALPALAVARTLRRPRHGAGTPRGLPFILLAEEPDVEFVLGLAGRFWTPTGGLVPATPDTFRQPPAPGLAHAAWNFRVDPAAHGCTVTTETRVLCADAATRRQFLRYWRVVRFGSGLIRRSMLREIRRRAERQRG